MMRRPRLNGLSIVGFVAFISPILFVGVVALVNLWNDNNPKTFSITELEGKYHVWNHSGMLHNYSLDTISINLEKDGSFTSSSVSEIKICTSGQYTLAGKSKDIIYFSCPNDSGVSGRITMNNRMICIEFVLDYDNGLKIVFAKSH